uniref:Uncharacterized protein n=1 Tax=Avena sativa TaxID=4498 RepID=A0ACD5Z3V4_AVESA
METSEEIIPQRVDPEKKPRVDGETQGRRSPKSTSSSAVSRVLDDDDLLIEILLRIDFPTTLVRAALVCKRWFHHVSDHAFLRSFRKLHPPRLLGFYINSWAPRGTPHFVPMLPAHPAELATVIHRAKSTFDKYKSDSTWTDVLDYRNGNVFIKHCEGRNVYAHGVHSLLCSERAMAVVPPFPWTELYNGNFDTCHKILSTEAGDYLHVLVVCAADGNDEVHVHRLQNGVWCLHHKFSKERLPGPQFRPKFMHVDNKIYMLAAHNDIIVLDLMASSFSTIQLPQGLRHGYSNTALSPVDDGTGVYLIHVKQLLLRIWLQNKGDWLLVETIYLPGMCKSLSILDCNTSLQIKHVGDNAEFVFLEMGRWILYLDIKCRTLGKVYEIPSMDPWCSIGDIYPFMMIWPPCSLR